MKLRLLAASTALAVATLAVVATLGGGAASAAAATPAAAQRPAASPPSAQIPCTAGGVTSVCTLTLDSLQVVNGALQASGTVTNGATSVPFTGVPVADPSGSCPILSLTLGPRHLDLLGLVVDLNQVVLNITAQPGPGQLLGNLLCSVAHLLDNNVSGTALTNLINENNAILAGL